jgi:homoserine kinase
MNQQTVTVRVPATSANLGPGFDAVGLAVTLFAEITIALDTAPPGRQPPDPMRRMVATAVRAAYKQAEQRVPRGLDIDVHSEIPLGRGFGASAAARAAGIVGANHAMGGLLSDQAVLDLGTKIEGHPDNIAPALFGGLQVVALGDNGAVERVAVPLKRGLRCVAFTPNFSMPTHETRNLLPKRLTTTDAVFNSSRAALLIAALATGRWDALGIATDERLHQRPRSKLFPRMYDLFDAARDAGAHGAYLSGGGSTILAFTDNAHAEPVRDAILQAADRFDITGLPFILDPCAQGATIIPNPA